MAETTWYTVVKGDTLWDIAQTYNTTVSALANLNNISNPAYIVVGQKIQITGAKQETTANTSNAAAITVFGLQSNTTSTVYACWTWSKSNTENYEVMWYYDTGDNVWFIGSDTTTEHQQSTYSAPSNAKAVKFKVRPVSEKKTVNDQEVSYWTANWSTERTYYFLDNPPAKPMTPTVNIEKYTLTAELDNVDVSAPNIEFQVVKDNTTLYKTGKVAITYDHVKFSCYIDTGHVYKVRCRAYQGEKYGEWSDWSGNVATIPTAPAYFTECKAKSKTSVYLEWDDTSTAETYDLEYATKREYLQGSNDTTMTSGIEDNHYELTGLESGQEYFFRVRAVNNQGTSAWSRMTSIILGKAPTAPTTWSSTTTVVVGEPLNLYWVHNTVDGSSQTHAKLQLRKPNTTQFVSIENSTDEDEKDKTSVYTVDTSEYTEGMTLKWCVSTRGITDDYSEWSILREVNIYAPATLSMVATNSNDEYLETLTNFPFKVECSGGPTTQTPVSYHLTISANESYETVDTIGNFKMITKGEEVYSKHFDTSESLVVDFSAFDVDLENNISYTINCVVSMNSGLTANASWDFKVAWSDVEYLPSAEIIIDKDTYSAYIKPFVDTDSDDFLLSVHRRNYDGSFVEIATGIQNNSETYVTDPHPSLDYARYRIVATSKTTGAVSYYDVPPQEVKCVAIIIQWNEEWTDLDTTSEDALAVQPWSGSMLKLPYNITVYNKYDPDIALIEYIGREHPVSYYGTQIGETATWNVDVPKNDTETIRTLHRLSKWMGDVYVREPSGTGYWASLSINFNKKYKDVVAPVTIDVTRVEGGI